MSVELYTKFKSFDLFLEHCIKNKLVCLNYNNTEIIDMLKKFYITSKEVKINNTNLRKILADSLGITAKSIKQIDFYIQRGYSTQYAKETVSNIQKNIANKKPKGLHKGRFTKQWFIDRYGEKEGIEKYNLKHQRSSHSLEQYIRRYGEKEGIEKYEERCMKNRGSKKDKFIKKYGEEEGMYKWNLYIERQRYTQTVDYFIEKYGKDEGTKKWLDAFGNLSGQSKIANNLFSNLKLKLTNVIDLREVYSVDREWCVFLTQSERNINHQFVIKPDFKYSNKIIEFFGNIHHANPRLYKPTFILPKSNKTAVKQWWSDFNRINTLKNRGFDVLVIWEDEYIKSPDDQLTRCIDFILS